jgi:hypothetical protein
MILFPARPGILNGRNIFIRKLANAGCLSASILQRPIPYFSFEDVNQYNREHPVITKPTIPVKVHVGVIRPCSANKGLSNEYHLPRILFPRSVLPEDTNFISQIFCVDSLILGAKPSKKLPTPEWNHMSTVITHLLPPNMK